MRVIVSILAVVATLGFIPGCLKDEPAAPRRETERASVLPDVESVSREILTATGWPAHPSETAAAASSSKAGSSTLDRVQMLGRFPIGGGVVHYSFRVRVGTGPYDVIGLHRVVREAAPARPIRTANNVFLLHGDYKDFPGCFLPGVLSPRIPDDSGFAFFLAQNDVDVWGIDQAWALVPDGVTDFSFMADWGMQKHVDWASIGVAVARVIRGMTGNGDDGMLLSGYSGGAPIGFALLNQETQLPKRLRKISGFIPVDQAMFTDVPEFDAAMCAFSSSYQALIDAGQYQDNIPLRLFGIPARDDPDGPSQLIPGLTNLQAALALAASPFIPGLPTHFLAGVFDGSGMPTGFQYASVDDWIDFLVSAPLYEAAAYERDEYLSACSQAGTVPWVSHFASIRVPILYVTAGGGFGLPYMHTLELLGSTDITHLNISTHPPEEAELDFAHIDLFLAADAPSRVWQPILSWIRDHSSHGGGRPDLAEH